jgi:hypothetical protein
MTDQNDAKAQAESEVDAALKLADRIEKVLKGKPPGVIGSALSNAVAMFIAGHFVPGSPEETNKHRERVLKLHISAVIGLVPANAAVISKRILDEMGKLEGKAN